MSPCHARVQDVSDMGCVRHGPDTPGDITLFSECIYAAGKDHGSLLGQHVLLDVLVGAALNAAQVEVCLTVLKGCSQDRQLPALLLTLTS